MKISRIPLVILLTLFLFACGGSNQDEPPAEPETAMEEVAEHVQAEVLNAEAVEPFRPTELEAKFLDAAAAVNSSGHTNGYFTNPDGVTGYFTNYELPFNFIWEGGTKTVTAIDGQTYQVMDGEGRLMIKYMGDDLLLQRYEGGFSEGMWHGYGHYLSRNGQGLSNSFVYTGEFNYDEMEGRGVFNDYDFYMIGASPTEYKGELKKTEFHGQGTETDLSTGEVTYKGLWFLGRPYGGTREQWLEDDAEYELRDPHCQYTRLIIVGTVEVGGYANDRPAEGFLTIIPPEDAKNVEISEAGGRSFTIGLMRHPARKTPDGSDLYLNGSIEDIPATAYPLTLTVAFEREGKREAVRLTIKRPFILELS
ncbi:hypothetical protein C4J81_09025 [Deltaproteobacteria bacterium Smac51]|nr:hypothetical protein C4J81_09025 [Deltaproteobacteria bacterium Smac51]